LDIDVNNSGDVYLTGMYQGPSDFDPSADTNTNTGISGMYDQIFIAKYDTSLNYKWVMDLGDQGYSPYIKDMGNGIYAKDDGTIFACGSFNGEADFDPSTEQYLIGASGTTNAYIASYNGNGLSFVELNEDNIALNQLKIFPNPCSDQFYVNSAIGINKISLRNLGGQVIESIEGKNEETILITCEELSTGMYFLEVLETDNRKSILRVIVE